MEITWENLHVDIVDYRVKTFLGIMLSSLLYLFCQQMYFFIGRLLLKSVTF